MQLIMILLIVVATLTILTGVAVLCGVTKQARVHGMWFFFSTLGAVVWSLAIVGFCVLPENMADLAPVIVTGIIAGITLTDIALLGYSCWDDGVRGKVTTATFALVGVVIIAILAMNPDVFYSGITFNVDFNQLHVTHDWYFYLLIIFFTIISLVYSGMLSRSIRRARNHGVKNGLRIFQVSLSVGGILALVFDLILITAAPNLVWVGPMAVSVSIIAFYYSVVKYRILAVSGRWMEILSYAILIAVGGVVYMLIFYALFTALFKVPNPSSGILILNFSMIAIVLCLMPALVEVTSTIRSLLPTRRIDVGYITRKLDRLSRYDVDIKELAGFLAMSLKYDYVGFLINGRIYESKSIGISEKEIERIKKLKATKNGIWQEYKESSVSNVKISGVAALKDAKGEIYGCVILGRHLAHRALEPKDIAEIEMVLKLSALVINERGKIKA